MPHFSASSISRLATCHPKLKQLMQAVIADHDIVIVCGHRGKAEQDKAVAAGTSESPWPNSKHNYYPSLAVDIAPWDPKEKRIPWERRVDFIKLAGIVKDKAKALGIKLRWGGDWDGDGDLKDQTFHDLPHFELVGVEGTLPGEEAA